MSSAHLLPVSSEQLFRFGPGKVTFTPFKEASEYLKDTLRRLTERGGYSPLLKDRSDPEGLQLDPGHLQRCLGVGRKPKYQHSLPPPFNTWIISVNTENSAPIIVGACQLGDRLLNACSRGCAQQHPSSTDLDYDGFLNPGYIRIGTEEHGLLTIIWSFLLGQAESAARDAGRSFRWATVTPRETLARQLTQTPVITNVAGQNLEFRFKVGSPPYFRNRVAGTIGASHEPVKNYVLFVEVGH